MELWDILDENGNKTGRTVERGGFMHPDEYHLIVHIWIQNSAGEYLVSKRTSNKTFPGMWATTGGAAIAGDDSLQSALREAKEELGVDLNPQSGRLLFRLKKHSEFPHFDDIWLFKSDIELSKLIFQPDEVSDAKWTTKEMILEMIDKKEFVNVYTYLGDLFKSSFS